MFKAYKEEKNMKNIVFYILILIVLSGCTISKGNLNMLDIKKIESDLQKSPPEEIPVSSRNLTPIPVEVLKKL